MSRKLTPESFQRLYPTPTEDFSRQMAAMLDRLPAQRKEIKMKKKLSVGLVLALALMLTTFSALAATLDWNVLDFLFVGNRDHAMKALVQDVNVRSSDGQVVLNISSAVTDGDSLAMDWTIVNEKPEDMVYVIVDEFTGNGVHLSTDGNDSFDCCWLPGMFSPDGSMQDGEIVELPDALRDADTLEVNMVVGVYHPKQPVYIMEDFEWPFTDADRALAEQKMAEGYLVVPEGDGLLMINELEDGEEGLAWVMFTRNSQGILELFDRTEMRVSFNLDMKAGRESVRQLIPQETYDAPFTASYTNLRVSPMGLTVEMDIFGLVDGDLNWSFELTDGNGALIECTRMGEGYIGTESAVDGTRYQHLHYTYYGLSEDMLPDVISMTYIPQVGEPVFFPVQVR